MHSATKYLGGHSDVVGGFVAVDDDELAERLRFTQNAAGAVPGAVRLLPRAARREDARPCGWTATARTPGRSSICSSATPPSSGCCYPQLPDHPGHAAAAKQMRDFGGMVSFTLSAAARPRRGRSPPRPSVFTLAESLGAVESLIEHPGAMTHASVAGSPLEVPPNLVRLSVGIEHSADLVADLDQALASL